MNTRYVKYLLIRFLADNLCILEKIFFQCKLSLQQGLHPIFNNGFWYVDILQLEEPESIISLVPNKLIS